MKAFNVIYKTNLVAKYSDIVFAENESDVPAALATKSAHGFDPNSNLCSISHVQSVGLETISVADLNVADLVSVIRYATQSETRVEPGAANALESFKNPCRFDEFTNEEFSHYSQYGGTFTYLKDLAHGTSFRVHNGGWSGKVLHRDGKTILQPTLRDNLCENGKNQLAIDKFYYAWISIIDGGNKA